MPEPPPAGGNEPFEGYQAGILARLDTAIAALPRRCRQVVILCYLQGASQSEAAERLGLPPGTVAELCSRGLAQLRAKLDTGEDRHFCVAALTALLREDAARSARAFSREPARWCELGALKAAAGSAAGNSPTTAIAEGALRIMRLQRLRMVAGFAAAALVLGAAALGIWRVAAGKAHSNRAPLVGHSTPETPVSVPAGGFQVFSTKCIDPDGDKLGYVWKIDNGPEIGNSEVLVYRPEVSNAGLHVVQVVVTDGRGGSTPRSWVVLVVSDTAPARPSQ